VRTTWTVLCLLPLACTVGGSNRPGAGGEVADPADAGHDSGPAPARPDLGPPPAEDVPAAAEDAGSDAALDAGADADAAAPVEDVGPPPGPVPNEGWIGGPCEEDSDCQYPEAAGGLCLRDADGWPGGTCSLPCDRLCPDREAPDVSVTFCVTGDEGDGRCLPRCDYELYPAGCREGYACAETPRHGEPGTQRMTCLPEDRVDPGAGPGQCVQQALALGLHVEPAEQRNDHPEDRPDLTCVLEDPVRLRSPVVGADYRYWYADAPAPMYMACRFALALQRLGEVLAEYDVVEVVHVGTYNCRAMRGSDELSVHGVGLAIDLGAFELADGTVYTLEEHWETLHGDPVTPGGRFLHDLAWRMYEDRIFNIVLTPDYDPGHATHFHVDLTPGSHFLGKPGGGWWLGTFGEWGGVE